jgi:hemerythrin-like domain-containing protein
VAWDRCGWGRMPAVARLVGMTKTTSATATNVHDMVVVHRGFRREFTLMPQLVRDVTAGDTARAGVVTEHARLLLAALHLHHTSEDELLWPKLLDRCPPDAALVRRMEQQHERVEHHTERLQAALGRWEVEARPAVTGEVASTFDALREALFEHLGEEESEILPRAARHVTQAEWNEIGQHGIAKMTKAQLPLLFGMILEEATPDEAAELYASVPPPVRLLTKLVFLPRYRRYVTKVRRPR